MDYRKQFRVEPGARVRLAEIDPAYKDPHVDKSDADDDIAADNKKLFSLQYLLYAENKRSLLIVLQGLDAAGKDGTIRHVFSALNPQGARVHSFKEPTPEESAHDFLWRAHTPAPRRGEIVIYNRSHYEAVLVERVHGLITKHVWEERYAFINDFEKNLAANDTAILKFCLHMSEAEQLRRFKRRLDDPERRWKISEADYAERALFPQYVPAYEEMLERTSTPHAPWFVIPSDHKWFRNLAVSKIVLETLDALGMQRPPVRADLDAIRRKYHDASS